MLLPSGYWVVVCHSAQGSLSRRGPKNPDAPGLQQNKNGPPGPEGNQKGPPLPPVPGLPEVPGITPDSFAPPDALTIITPPFIVTPSVPPLPAADEPPFLATTTSSPDPSSSPLSTSVTSTVLTQSLSSTTSIDSTTSAISLSSLVSQTSTSSGTLSLVSSAPQSSVPTESITVTSAPAKTTSQSSIYHTTSATTMETPWGYQSQNGTVESESHGALSQGQKAGISIGTLVGVSLILSLLYWFFRRRNGGHLKSILRLGRRQQAGSADPPWPRNRPFDVLPDSPMAEASSSTQPPWNHQEAFARAPAMAKARQSLPRSLRFLRVNPLGMNPVTPPVSRPRTPSRKSFASSFFHRRSTISTLHSVSVPPSEERLASMRGPHSLRPLFIPPFRLQPAASQSAHFTDATKSAAGSTHSLAAPSQTFSRSTSQQRRHSHLSTSPADRDPRSARAIFDRTRPRLPSKLSRSQTATAAAATTVAAAGGSRASGPEVPQRSEQDPPPLPQPHLPLRPVMPQRPLSTLSTSSKRDRILRPSNSLLDSHLDISKANAGIENDTPPPPPLKSPRRASAALNNKIKE